MDGRDKPGHDVVKFEFATLKRASHDESHRRSHARRAGHAGSRRRNISFEIEKGQRFKMTQPEGEQVRDLVSLQPRRHARILSMLCSRAVNLSYKFTAPMTLYSNLSREMWKIDEDLNGENCAAAATAPST